MMMGEEEVIKSTEKESSNDIVGYATAEGNTYNTQVTFHRHRDGSISTLTVHWNPDSRGDVAPEITKRHYLSDDETSNLKIDWDNHTENST